MPRGRRRPNGAGRVDRDALWNIPAFQRAARELSASKSGEDHEYLRQQLHRHRNSVRRNTWPTDADTDSID